MANPEKIYLFYFLTSTFMMEDLKSSEKHSIDQETMTEKPQEVFIKDKKLTCPACMNQTFWSDASILRQPPKSALSLNPYWKTTKKASHYICSECGYMFFFVDKNAAWSLLGVEKRK